MIDVVIAAAYNIRVGSFATASSAGCSRVRHCDMVAGF